ncbi:MAG: helix-turn-helix transcriptional regulator [Propionicimonas sp.]
MTDREDAVAGSHHGVEFGHQLRESRLHRGMSQVALGGDKYSGSYISHLESGRRAPTAEVIEFLTRRLGVSALEWGIQGPSTTTDPGRERSGSDVIENLLVAERARSDRDWIAAEAHAEKAASGAAAAGDSIRHWEATYVVAQAKFAGAQFAAAADMARQLAEHEAAREFPVARAQALSLASIAYRSSDRLGWAVAYAARAVEAASSAPPIILAEALMALVSALSEAGHTSGEVALYVARLEAISPRLTSDHSRGMVAWAIGTAAFKSSDVARGLAWHEQAKALLDPQRDLRLWLRFHRAAANCRLDAGLTEGVPELLRVSATALEIIGNPLDVVELRQAQARLALLEGDPATAMTVIRGIMDDPALGSSKYSRAASELILADSAAALGEHDLAVEQYSRAARDFELEGRLTKSIEAWRRATAAGADPS